MVDRVYIKAFCRSNSNLCKPDFIHHHSCTLFNTPAPHHPIPYTIEMYLRNFLAAASFVALVASAALPETQGAYVPGFEKSCVEGCKADGTANVG